MVDQGEQQTIHCPGMNITNVFKSGMTAISVKALDGLFGSANYAFMDMWRDSLRRTPPIGFFLVVVASGGVLSEGCGHGGHGVCLGDGQTEAKGVPS